MALTMSWSGAGYGADITITYWENLIDDGGVQDEVISKFEASHPGVTVNRVTLQLDDLSVKLPSALGTKAGPDLVYGDVSPQFLGSYVKAGRVLDMSDAYGTYGWNDRVYPWAKERASYNGKVYGVGHEVEDLGLMYNKKIFAELGISVPKTLQQLTDAMATIKAKSTYTPMTLACANGCYNGIHVINDITYATMPTATALAATPAGNGAYTDTGWLGVLQTFKAWNDAGYFTKGANGIDFDNHWADFCAGKAAMLTQGTWLFKTIDDCAAQSNGALDWGNAPFPVADGLPFQAYVGIGSGWFAPSNLSADPDKEKAVLDLIDAFISPEAANAWVTKAQIFPAVPFDDSAVKLTEQQKASLQIITAAGKNGGAVPIAFNNSAAESQVWATGLQGIVDGSTTPEQLIQQLQAQLAKSQAAWKS
jgi:raffinose/stachyose/melibiose transport system substrate-binding protein